MLNFKSVKKVEEDVLHYISQLADGSKMISILFSSGCLSASSGNASGGFDMVSSAVEIDDGTTLPKSSECVKE